MKENARNALDFADPGPLPKELMDMPGFVNGLKEYTMRTAPRPNEVLAFAGWATSSRWSPTCAESSTA